MGALQVSQSRGGLHTDIFHNPAHAEAREPLEKMLSQATPSGLLSEDIDPRTGELWGNFPRTDPWSA